MVAEAVIAKGQRLQPIVRTRVQRLTMQTPSIWLVAVTLALFVRPHDINGQLTDPNSGGLRELAEAVFAALVQLPIDEGSFARQCQITCDAEDYQDAR